jgi:hypothetical protein
MWMSSKLDFKNPQKQNKDSYYDLFEDYDLIEASFATQYGIRLSRETEMTWGEFTRLLSGIMEGPLAEIVKIRSEKDPEMLKHFTPEQKRIRNDWQKRKAKRMNKSEYDAAMKQLDAMFKAMGTSQQGR